MANSNLAVCPSAACSPRCGAKVPHAIALWLAVLRRPVHCGAVASHRTWYPAVMAKGHHCLAFSKITLKLQAISGRCMATNWRHNGRSQFRGGYALCNQIRGTGKWTQAPFHFAPQPNFSVKPTPTSSACRFPACFALRCGLPRALGIMNTNLASLIELI